MRYYGKLDFSYKNAQCEKYYSDDKVHFFHEGTDRELTEKELSDWTVCMNSPWSQTNETYKIRVNCKDGYTPITDGEPTWLCEYTVVGYEGITASVVGYGNTEEEALHDCKVLFAHLQTIYNPEDESF